MLASAYASMYYAVEGNDGTIKFYDIGFNEMKPNSSAVIDGRETPLPFITIPESVTERLSDPDFAQKYISPDAEVKNVYILSGENSRMGTAICYRTNVGDYIYYCHYNIAEKLFSFKEFRKFQQAVKDEIIKHSDLDGSADMDISKVWDLSKYELKEVGEKSEQKKALEELTEKEISDIGEYRRERAVITGALSADAPRLTLKQVNEIINASSSLREIYDKINKAQPYPDFYGGSGISLAEYWLNDEGTERVVIIIEDNAVLYHRYGNDGKLAEWKELYSNKNGASFNNGEPSSLKGDANLDGKVDLADLTSLAKYILSNETYPLANETAYANADMNGDGKVDGIDMSALIEQQLGK